MGYPIKIDLDPPFGANVIKSGRTTGTTSGKIIGKNAVPVGIAPAIMLVEPRFPHNVGMVVRLASCYGFSQVWFTGDRVRLEMDRMGRLPREERMKGYKDVKMILQVHDELLFEIKESLIEKTAKN